MKPDLALYTAKSRHLSFEGADDGPKAVGVLIFSKSDGIYLGSIEYLPAWRQYVYGPPGDKIIWSHGCLMDLAALIDWLNKEQRKP